jgi:hypothetical protein
MRGAYETPSEQCPLCGTLCQAEYVDVGVGLVQVTPHHCEDCGATEMGLYDDPPSSPLTSFEEHWGWYLPGRKFEEEKRG